MNTNIQGLSSALENLKRKLELLQKEIDSFEIKGGDNILVSRFKNSFIISTDDQSSGVAEIFPWQLFVDEEGDENKKKVSCNAGLVNGIQAGGIEDIVTLSEGDQKYIYWEARTDGSEIQSVEVKHSNDAPDIKNLYVKNAFPNKVTFLIGFVTFNGVKYQFLKNHVNIMPEIAYQEDNLSEYGLVDNYYTWVVHYL